MLLSIIIPVFNEAVQLPRLLQHLQAEDAALIAEIIVVDGGSTDETVTIARQFGVTVLSSPTGRAVQMNAGARVAKGQVLYFIHADTLPPAGFPVFIRQALADGWPMGCFRYRFDSDRFMLRINSWFTRFYFMFCQGGDKTFFIQKNIFEQLHGYDEQFVIMEEYDFLKRAAKAGLPYYIIPEKGLVSSRKYEGRSWLKVQLANLVVFNAWRFRLVQPEKLKLLYRELLR